jgi:hypothetical protein
MLSPNGTSTFTAEFEGSIVPDETNIEGIDAGTEFLNRNFEFKDIIMNFQNRSDDILRKYSEKVSAN